MARADSIPVEVVYCAGPEHCDRVTLDLPPGATLEAALRASGILARNKLSMDGLLCGVWGKLREPTQALREGDRVEIYRPLQVDPKEARRLRYKGQKERRAAAAAPPAARCAPPGPGCAQPAPRGGQAK